MQAELKPLAPALQTPVDTPNGAIVAIVPEERPIPVTAKIFAPLRSNMSKGFLIYSRDEGTSKWFFCLNLNTSGMYLDVKRKV